MNNTKEHGGHFWFGLFLGGLVGGFIIFLLGTKEGKKLIERLIEKTEMYEEELEEKIEQLQQKGEDLAQEVQEVKEKVARKVKEEKNKASETVVSKMDAALSKLEDIQKKGVEVTEEFHRNYFKKDGKPLVS